MPSYVAFLRAVNVTNRWVKMAALREALTADGWQRVQTHIHSGNLCVETAESDLDVVARSLEEGISRFAGFPVPCMVRLAGSLPDLVAEIDASAPMLDPVGRRYVAFARSPVHDEGAARLAAWDRPGERARRLGGEVLLELGVDFHKTTLNGARIERLIDNPVTARDLKVVRAVAEKWGTP